MALVFHRKLATPLWTIAFFTVALTAQPPTTPFLMPMTTLFVIATVGIAGIVFSMSGAMPWVRASRALARVPPIGRGHHASAVITVAAESCVRMIEASEPGWSEADDARDLGRMDDAGGWQNTRPTT